MPEDPRIRLQQAEELLRACGRWVACQADVRAWQCWAYCDHARECDRVVLLEAVERYFLGRPRVVS